MVKKIKKDIPPVKNESGEFEKYSVPEDTGEYDLETYAYVFEQLTLLGLNCFWRITSLSKGVMLYLSKGDDNERIYIESSKSFKEMKSTIVTWATYI